MIEISYDHARGVLFTQSGEFDFDEVVETFLNLFGDERFSHLKYWILDRTGVVNYSMTSEQVHKLCSMIQTASTINRDLVHIFISKTDLQYGMANVARFFIEETGWTVLNFRDLNTAKKWIDENIPS